VTKVVKPGGDGEAVMVNYGEVKDSYLRLSSAASCCAKTRDRVRSERHS